ncbi:hypothetical protein ITP53_18460 [Nonomuraea sp. K274]|uniref:Uncharacterized protein n=1 Tax=Nonomuraea cypriaca TaxID=1187855 RepID=A0A931ABU2_9ACTN|nr:hypothetical protein [Nonomuraea cypriaca]MBF8187683.1 hypothetical protein [Nonomuraea cypriaca]
MTTARASVRVPQWVFAELSEELGEKVRRAIPLMRSPDEVMRPRILHGMTASKLSFAQTLVRHMAKHQWRIELRECDVAEDGTGFLAYDIRAEELHLSFGVFVYPPLPLGHQRLFRDTQVEFLGVLLDGPIDKERFLRERAEFGARLWRGRTDPKVYGWTIASRGTRTFEEVVDALASGRQPAVSLLDANGGYILRNGGYYGNGRMGTRAWQSYARHGGPLSMPYHIDLFCVYLWRLVSLDLVDATARARNPEAVTLDPRIRRHVGIGNSSGLGTVAALVRWPARLSAFVLTRELGVAYSTAQPPDASRICRLAVLLENAATAYRNAPEAAPELIEPREEVAAALLRARDELDGLLGIGTEGDGAASWAPLLAAAAGFGSVEAVEVLRTLLLELYPETSEFSRVTAAGMTRSQTVDPTMTVGELRAVLEEHFGWALTLDLHGPGRREFFWYRSEENGENRRGERSVDVGIERETFIDVAGVVRRLHDFLTSVPDEVSVGRFLLEEPEHALSVARVQLAAEAPYSELRASVCDADFLASNGIRCFLSVLGIELPTPHSGRWVRGLFFRGAPLPADLAAGREGEWGIGAAAAATGAMDDDAAVRV